MKFEWPIEPKLLFVLKPNRTDVWDEGYLKFFYFKAIGDAVSRDRLEITIIIKGLPKNAQGALTEVGRTSRFMDAPKDFANFIRTSGYTFDHIVDDYSIKYPPFTKLNFFSESAVYPTWITEKVP